MPVSPSRNRRIMSLDTKLAYPGKLGGGQLVPPPGMAFLTDDNGVYLLDDNGNYLVGEVA